MPADRVETPSPTAFRAPVHGGRNLLSRYLAMLTDFPPITPEAERVLIRRYYAEGDESAGRTLVTANMRLVVKLAMKHGRDRSQLLDLIQEGNVGLLEALRRFEPTKEVRFATYARHWVRAMMLKHVMDNHRVVRVGSTRSGRKLFFQLRKEQRRLEQEGQPPTAARLAERLGVEVEEIWAVQGSMHRPAMSLEAPAAGDDEGRALGEMLADPHAESPESAAAREEERELVDRHIASFAERITDPRDRSIWEQRTLADDPKTLSALGREFSVSKERVRQLEAQMKAELRQVLEREFGEVAPALLLSTDRLAGAAVRP